ncbi:MAG: 6-phosphogluconolactonase [Vulcanimicrobiaceae bacterium]
MSESQFIVAADEAALAKAVAEHVVEVAHESLAARGRFDLALAGGSTPKAAYQLLAAAPLRERVDGAKVRFFFGDERCVPPDDAQSNYKMAHDALLGPLSIPPERIFRMHGEDDPPSAARSYARTLLEQLGSAPVLDLVMLGMGPDGHTASLFPGTDPLLDDEALVRAPYVEKFSTYRLSLTPRVINAARNVAIAAAGKAKAEALRDVLEGPHDPIRRPIQVVQPTSGTLTWLLDRAAVTLLKATVYRSV